MTEVAFEKWQALGNDYLIFEEASLPWALTPERIERICDVHTGVGSDGILLLSEPDEPGFVARLRIFNPDGSESGLSGNGAREAVMYLRRHGWATSDRFSIQTGAGEIRPTSPGRTPARWTWAARASPRRTSRAATPTARPRCTPTVAPGAFSTSTSATRSARSTIPTSPI